MAEKLFPDSEEEAKKLMSEQTKLENDFISKEEEDGNKSE